MGSRSSGWTMLGRGGSLTSAGRSGLESWRVGELEAGKLESWRAGELEVGELESWKLEVGELVAGGWNLEAGG